MTDAKISPHDLWDAIRGGTRLQIVDVRSPDAVRTGAVSVGPAQQFVNIRGSVLTSTGDVGNLGIAPDLPVVTVCGRGRDSLRVAGHLVSLGLDARSLDGGMKAWMSLLVGHDISGVEDLDHLVQFDRPGKGSLSYMLVRSGEALIIDPPRNSGAIASRLETIGAKAVGIVDTHIHADYLSGASALSDQLGVPYYLHPADRRYPYDGRPGALSTTDITDGRRIRLGDAHAEVMHTPGHTEGSVTVTLGRSAAFTGDFLFVGSIGRPDLAGKAEEWSRLLWASLQRARTTLGGECLVLPGHYASWDERASDGGVGRQFGELTRRNPAMQYRTKEEFLAWVNAAPPTFPDTYRRIKAVNLGLEEVTGEDADVLELGKNECAVTEPHVPGTPQ